MSPKSSHKHPKSKAEEGTHEEGVVMVEAEEGTHRDGGGRGCCAKLKKAERVSVKGLGLSQPSDAVISEQ